MLIEIESGLQLLLAWMYIYAPSTIVMSATAFCRLHNRHTMLARIWYSIASIRHNRTKWYGLGFIKCENCALPVSCGRATHCPPHRSDQRAAVHHNSSLLVVLFVRLLGLPFSVGADEEKATQPHTFVERTVISERHNRAQISSFNDFFFRIIIIFCSSSKTIEVSWITILCRLLCSLLLHLVQW